MSTLAYPPFMLARLCSTLDHIAGGRFGWNIVTSGEDTAAQNFGLDKLPPREQRYEMADEYVDLVCKLFDSWDPDAVVMDRASWHLCRLPQGPADPFRGQVFQGPRPAEHRALAAGQAGVRAGRRLAARAGLRREARRLDHRHRQRHRRHEAVPRRRAPPRGGIRAQPRRHQGAVPDLPDAGRDRRRGAGEAAADGVLAAFHRASAGQHRHSDRHRLLPVRSRPTAAAADNQRRTRLARQVRPMGQRQDPASACDGALRRARVGGRLCRLARHRRRAHGECHGGDRW